MPLPSYLVVGHGNLIQHPFLGSHFTLGPNQYVVFLSRPGFELSDKWYRSMCLKSPVFETFLPGYMGPKYRAGNFIGLTRTDIVYFNNAFEERFYGPGDECPNLNIQFFGDYPDLMGIWKLPFFGNIQYQTSFSHQFVGHQPSNWLNEVVTVGGPGLYVVHSCRNSVAAPPVTNETLARLIQKASSAHRKGRIGPVPTQLTLNKSVYGRMLNTYLQNVLEPGVNATAGATNYTRAIQNMERARIKATQKKRGRNNTGNGEAPKRRTMGPGNRSVTYDYIIKNFKNHMYRPPNSVKNLGAFVKAVQSGQPNRNAFMVKYNNLIRENIKSLRDPVTKANVRQLKKNFEHFFKEHKNERMTSVEFVNRIRNPKKYERLVKFKNVAKRRVAQRKERLGKFRNVARKGAALRKERLDKLMNVIRTASELQKSRSGTLSNRAYELQNVNALVRGNIRNAYLAKLKQNLDRLLVTHPTYTRGKYGELDRIFASLGPRPNLSNRNRSVLMTAYVRST